MKLKLKRGERDGKKKKKEREKQRKNNASDATNFDLDILNTILACSSTPKNDLLSSQKLA
jgi:hypothetical protein